MVRQKHRLRSGKGWSRSAPHLTARKRRRKIYDGKKNATKKEQDASTAMKRSLMAKGVHTPQKKDRAFRLPLRRSLGEAPSNVAYYQRRSTKRKEVRPALLEKGESVSKTLGGGLS